MSARGREAAAVAASKTVDVAQVVVCGVDSSDESIEAVRQSAVLAGPRGRLVLVSVINSGMAAPAGFAVTTSPAELERAARRDLERVRVAVADRCPTEERIVEGLPVPALRAQAAELHATLIACGVHGRSRLLGAVRGSVATALLHASACSVLAAR